ncbi:MAG: hypothetical protein ACLUNZ_00790 [Evtepia sp.]
MPICSGLWPTAWTSDKEPSKEGKIIAKIIDVLEDVGWAVEDLEVEVGKP